MGLNNLITSSKCTTHPKTDYSMPIELLKEVKDGEKQRSKLTEEMKMLQKISKDMADSIACKDCDIEALYEQISKLGGLKADAQCETVTIQEGNVNGVQVRTEAKRVNKNEHKQGSTNTSREVRTQAGKYEHKQGSTNTSREDPERIQAQQRVTFFSEPAQSSTHCRLSNRNNLNNKLLAVCKVNDWNAMYDPLFI
ncbi:hypothetical protein EOD39_10085 [Acipenser ruthenus]|uniref:Uncharacterized protein n=1 Tax=Acipenser ruthenus TaxID=7906 RepID=A0A662YXA4_ACIRT|nr:hypothetical protein EOD39_10085 [Acipenser ruthenus]